VNHI